MTSQSSLCGLDSGIKQAGAFIFDMCQENVSSEIPFHYLKL